MKIDPAISAYYIGDCRTLLKRLPDGCVQTCVTSPPIHNRHGVKVNPLYQRGHSRVGCYPCIYAGKEEIALIAAHAPERITEIRQLEAEMLALRRSRNEERPGRYKHVEDASFFQTQRQGFSGIDAVVNWARTDHGGRQLPLFAPVPRGGCMRWGICDMPDESPSRANPEADLPWVCAECGYEQLEDEPCKACRSVRVVTIKVIRDNFGPNWRSLFQERE